MESFGSVHLLEEPEILAGQWAQNLHEFHGFTLFKTSGHRFFCDTGPGQLVGAAPLNGDDKTWVMTLVGASFSYQNLRDVLSRLKADQSQLIAVKTLSTAPVAIEVYFQWAPHAVSVAMDWWQEWLVFTDGIGVDIGVQPASNQGLRCRLACFDMDSTLIKAEVIDELAAEAGLMAEVSAITEQAMRGELDFQQSFTQRLAMLKGLKQAAVESVLNRIQFMDGAQELFRFLRVKGIYSVILSGGFDVFARHVQQQLDIDEVHANHLSFVDGALTGQAVEPIMDAKNKRATLKALAEKLGIPLSQTLAVGDGANDLLMLDQAGIGIAFKAKPKVQTSARIAIRHGSLQTVPFFLGFDATRLKFH